MQVLARPFFGARVDDDGAVEQVWPGSPADAVGLRIGDRVISIDGVPVRTTAQLLDQLAQHRPGELATLVLSHEGELRIGPLMVVADPADVVEGAEVVRGLLTVDAVHRNTVLVRPSGIARPPVVVVLGDPGSGSAPPSARTPELELVAGLARAGIATLRLEACDPAAPVERDDELRAARAAISELGVGRWLDTDAIVVFAHGPSTDIAPRLTGARVRGIVVYGGVAATEAHVGLERWRGVVVPTLLLHGERDEPTHAHRHAEIAELLAAAGVTAHAGTLAGYDATLRGPDRQLLYETLAFVQSVSLFA